ncbi:hypothetical protein DM01DRAFT_1377835 [Hesseltinella vesiculosa]|uniref:TRP C-terminal domain-containing protein n=1 Tax=Hesseltinella vesiculosa TaxID=101127 RepID=A0A1X2G689_9FUNG|nr:hypothetical protein DM01DRAFT_1377835 [Hesseltinella vesiculosa]
MLSAQIQTWPVREAAKVDTKLFRMMYEGTWFIVLEIWRLWLVMDALSHFNTLTVITTAILTFMSVIFGLLAVVETTKFINEQMHFVVASQIPAAFLSISQMSRGFQIALTVILAVLVIPTVYLVYRLYHEYGWRTYKKVGASLALQQMYAQVNAFVLVLKLDSLFQGLNTVFFIAQAATAYHQFRYPPSLAVLVMSVIGFVLIIANESKTQIVSFITIQTVFLGFNLASTVLMSSDDPWYFFILYETGSVLLTVVSIALAIKCLLNFSKGLKSHVQWSLVTGTIIDDGLNKPLDDESLLLDVEEYSDTLEDRQHSLLKAIHRQHQLSRNEMVEQS